MRILLLNLGVESIQQVEQALSGQGYEITTSRSLTVDEILALSADILITEATPSNLSCCGVISQIKAGHDPRTPKIDNQSWSSKQGCTTHCKKSHIAESAVEALSGDMNAKRRSWLMPAIFMLGAAVILAALATVISNRHSRKDTLQLKAEVARLNSGFLQAGRTSAPCRPGASVPGRKQRVGNARVFEGANRTDPQENGRGRHCR